MPDQHMLLIDSLAQSSGLSKVNTSFKMALGIAALLLCLLSRTLLPVCFVIAGMMYLTIGIGGTSLSTYFRLLKIPAVFIILSIIAIVIEFSSTPSGLASVRIFHFYVNVTPASLQHGLMTAAKAYGGVTCLYMISLSTPLSDIISFLQRMKTPAVITELMYFIYRYIMILLEVQHHMSVSARSRQGNLNRRNKLRSVFRIASSLLFISFQRVNESYNAMVSRGYQGMGGITALAEPARLHKKELLLGLCYIGLLTVLICYERIYL